jgi:integrase
LTDRFLTSRKAPVAGRAIFTDTVVPGLGPLVFALGGKRPMALHQLIERVLRDAGLVDVRLHDLRRTVRTGLAELGIPWEVAERVLNHAIPGLQAVYNRHSYSGEKRRALQLWAEHVLATAKGSEPRVVALRSAVVR